jgi:hypothetical protein
VGSYEIQWFFHGFEVPETNGSLIREFSSNTWNQRFFDSDVFQVPETGGY